MPSTANKYQNQPFRVPPSSAADTRQEAVEPFAESSQSGFTERRASSVDGRRSERRQFGSSHNDLSPDARELAVAIDRYKIDSRRRYITCEEMLAVVKQLGYRRD
jgi:hypothetical protein